MFVDSMEIDLIISENGLTAQGIARAARRSKRWYYDIRRKAERGYNFQPLTVAAIAQGLGCEVRRIHKRKSATTNPPEVAAA